MPSKRADGTLVFSLLCWGPVGSGKSTLLQWFGQKQPNKDEHFKLIQNEGDAGAHLEYGPKKKWGDVAYAIYAESTKAGEEPKLSPFLRGADGLAFVWDSTPEKLAENISSLKQLFQIFGPKIIVREGETDLNALPFVILANKREVYNPTPITKIQEVLEEGKFGKYLIYETQTASGVNVFRALTYVMREMVLRHYRRLQAGGTDHEDRVDLNKYQEIFQEIQDRCVAHDFAGARTKLRIAEDWNKRIPLSTVDLKKILPELSGWGDSITRGEKSYKVWTVTRDLAKKYPRVHIIELVKHVGLPQPETLELLLELIAQEKVPAKYDPESEGIDLKLYMEELDDLRKSFDEWGAPRQGKKV